MTMQEGIKPIKGGQVMQIDAGLISASPCAKNHAMNTAALYAYRFRNQVAEGHTS